MKMEMVGIKALCDLHMNCYFGMKVKIFGKLFAAPNTPYVFAFAVERGSVMLYCGLCIQELFVRI